MQQQELEQLPECNSCRVLTRFRTRVWIHQIYKTCTGGSGNSSPFSWLKNVIIHLLHRNGTIMVTKYQPNQPQVKQAIFLALLHKANWHFPCIPKLLQQMITATAYFSSTANHYENKKFTFSSVYSCSKSQVYFA